MKNIQENILKYKIYFITKWYHFLAPVLMIYILSFDLSLIKATIAISTSFYIMSLIFEIPSGIFADIFGRKRTLNLASFFLLLGILLFSFGSGFWIFLFAGVFWGIGMAFDSGASNALLYDTLIELKREKEFKKIQGNILFTTYLFMGLSSIIAIYFYNINPRFPFYLASISVFIAFITSLLFKEPKYPKTNKKTREHLIDSLRVIFKNKKVLWIGIYSIILLEFIFIFTRNFIQPYLLSSGMKILYFGVLFASFRVFSSIGAKYSHKLENYFNIENSLLLLLLGLGLVFFILGIYIQIYSFILILVMYFILGASRPLIDDYLNVNIKSNKRATIFSIICLMGSLLNILFAIVLASAIELISFTFALYLISGIIGVVLIGLYLTYK